MPGATYPTKKALKAAIGTSMRGRFVETSHFGEEWPKNGTGDVTVVGPCPYTARKWYATVTLRDGVIVKVK